MFTLTLIVVLTGKAWTAPLVYHPSNHETLQTISCQIPVNKIGTIALTNGLATISGNTIDISSTANDYSAPNSNLRGVVLKIEIDQDTMPNTITGLAYFQSGDSLPDINNTDLDDSVFKSDGAIAGKIIGIQNQNLVIALPNGSTKLLSMATVRFVRSPRAFLFVIKLNNQTSMSDKKIFALEADSIAFKPTMVQRTIPLSSVIPKNSVENEDLSDDIVGSTKNKQLNNSAEDEMNLSDPDNEEPIPFKPFFKWQNQGMRQFP